MTDMPTSLVVTVAVSDPAKAQCTATWQGPADAVKYPWSTGLNAGGGDQTGVATGKTCNFSVPYAAQPQSAWFCVKAQNAQGVNSADQTCVSFTVPVAPVKPPDTIAAPSATPKSVSIEFTGTPPDTAGGWTMQLFEGNIAISMADIEAPFAIIVDLKSGTHAVKACWSKGTTVKWSDAATVVCP